MAEINTFTISGLARLSRSGEFNDGTPWVNFSLCHSAYKGKDDDGQNKYENQWFECSMTGGLAGVVADQLSEEESHKVTVQGELMQDRWETNEGEKRSMVKLRVRNLIGAARLGEGTLIQPKAQASSNSGGGEPF